MVSRCFVLGVSTNTKMSSDLSSLVKETSWNTQTARSEDSPFRKAARIFIEESEKIMPVPNIGYAAGEDSDFFPRILFSVDPKNPVALVLHLKSMVDKLNAQTSEITKELFHVGRVLSPQDEDNPLMDTVVEVHIWGPGRFKAD